MLTTDRLILRRPAKADIDAVYEIHSDPETNVHNPAGPMQTRADAAEFFELWNTRWLEDGYGYWTVVHKDMPERVIGFGGVMKKQLAPEMFDNNLYFRFRPEAWGHGYAGEMVSAALAHTFGEAAQPYVFGVARSYNTPSRKTLERAGFELVGTVHDVAGEEPSVLYRLESEAFLQQVVRPC